MNQLAALEAKVERCSACPRLVRWRELVAQKKRRRFQDWEYWGKPVPGFGDPHARLLLIGLAPAAHGGNRTGRMFTGDRSGDWLYRALHKFGFADRARSESRDDGMTLNDCYITATCRCAPPHNKLLPKEIRSCRPFLLSELKLLPEVKVIIGLGKVGFDTAVQSVLDLGWATLEKKPRFAHGASAQLGRITLLGTFHPSQQNTFTGRLTEPMFDEVFLVAKSLLERTSA